MVLYKFLFTFKSFENYTKQSQTTLEIDNGQRVAEVGNDQRRKIITR